MTLQVKPLILLFITVCLFTISCKKDDSKIDNLPTTLYFRNLTFKDDIKVYTRDGEITDPVVRAQSIISTGVGLVAPNPSSTGHVTFLSDNSFLLNNDSYNFKKTGDTFIFNDIDSAIVGPQDGWIAALPFYKYPTATKIDNGNYIYRRQFVGYGNYSALKISGMDYGILKRDTVTRAIIERRVEYQLNEFNRDGIKALGKYDTMAVREYSYQYELIK
jgi:hypothetical protein